MSGPRMLADEMLGKLARELRALGYDVAYRKHVEDDELRAQAARTGRRLLTRDKALAEQAGENGLLIRARDPLDQVEEVLEGLALTPDPERFLSRCLVCNLELEPAGDTARVPEDVDDPVPVACPGCQRVYWEGSHVRDMRDRLGGFLGDDGNRNA